MKRLFALALACLIASPAWAGSSTVEYTSAGSSPFRTTTDGSSYNLSNVTIWDSAAGANGWKIDSSNGGLVAGEGVAGTPAGGVFSIQGVSGGTAVPVSGTFYQATQPVSIASAQIASGAVASGAFASGAVASGAFASGSLAAGSMVDLLTMRAPIGGTSSSPADVLVGGCQYNASAPTFTTGNSGAVQCTINGSVHTTVDNTNANVTPANATATTAASPVWSENALYNGTTWDNAPGDHTLGAYTDIKGVNGAAFSITNPFFNELTDGTNGPVAVKPASTAAVATDNSLVMQLNPDSPGIIALGPAADTSSVPIIQGPTSSATNALTAASTTALGTSKVLKASAGNFYGANVTGVTGGAAGYLIIYNGTTAPSTGALTGANVLDFCYFDTTPRGCSISYIPLMKQYSTGIVALVSSAVTPYTYTTGTDTAAISGVVK